MLYYFINYQFENRYLIELKIEDGDPWYLPSNVLIVPGDNPEDE